MAAELRAELGDDVAPDDACEWGYRQDRRGPAGRPRPHRRALRHVVLRADACTSAATSAEVLRLLDERGVTFEADGARWLRATDFGDTRDRVPDPLRRLDDVSRATTSPTTATSSTAGFTHLIDIWGADHHGQVKSLHAGLEALGLPARRARDHPRAVREAAARTARRSGCRSGPATSSPSPTSSTRSTPTSPAWCSCCRASTRRRRSTSTSSPRSRWRTPSTTCSTRTRASRRSVASAADAGVDASTARRRRPLAAHARARRGTAARAGAVSRRRRRGGRARARRRRSRRGCATSRARSTASTATVACSPTTPSSRRRACGSPKRAASDLPTRSACSACTRPTRWRASMTDDEADNG